MSRKPIGLALVLAAAALALTPAAADAFTEPHYFQNGVLQTATPRAVVEWGTLALNENHNAGFPTCHVSAAGTIVNPVGGGPGQGLTQVFAFYDCEKEPCGTIGLGEPQVRAERLPWPSQLESINVHEARSKTTGINLATGCEEAPGTEKFVPLTKHFGSLQPQTKNGGGKAGNPGFLECEKGCGQLEQEPEGGGLVAGLEGKLKILGYANQEVIGVCDVTMAEGAPSVCP
jgi:hypothetical protein